MKHGIRKFLRVTIRLLVSIVILYYVLRQIDLSALKTVVQQSKFWLAVPAAIFFILSKIVSAYRLNSFFRSRSLVISGGMNMRLYWLGMFYNLFLPGGIGGDGYKVFFLHRKLKLSARHALLAIVFDRITGMLALVFLCMVFVLFFPDPLISRWMIAAGMLIIIALFYGVVYQWFHSFFGILNQTNLQSMGVQLLQVVSALLLLKALGHTGPVIPYLFVFLVSSVVAVIPITIGGVGAREATFLFASQWLGLDAEISIMLSLLFFFITAVVSLWGIVYAIEPEKMISGSAYKSEAAKGTNRKNTVISY